jgi:hypothetical protein
MELARAHSLDRWASHNWPDGLQVPDLAPLDRLLVRTRNHLYELIVLEPHRAQVLVRGGRHFPQFARVVVAGSSVGGGFLKLHGIYQGFRLELYTGSQVIITSPIREITRTDDEPAGDLRPRG